MNKEAAVIDAEAKVTPTPKDKRRRADGLWLDLRTPGKPVWCIRFKGLDGRSHRERTTAVTREQARAVLHQRTTELLKARIAGVTNVEAIRPLSLASFIENEYLKHIEATHTPSTFRTDKERLKAVLPFFGRMNLRAITAGDIQRFIDQRSQTVYLRSDGSALPKRSKIRPATINRERMFVSGILSEAMRRGYIDRNPAIGIPQLPENNIRIRWLSASEETRCLNFSPAWLRPIVRTALLTGMRQGELLALTWADVDFSQRIVRVTRTKNHKTRYIPMNASLVTLLESFKPDQETWEKCPFVFTNTATEDQYKDVGHTFACAVRKAGLRDVSFHSLRHTFASRLAQAGVPLNTIRELLGHGSMAMTMRYAHLAPSNLRDAVDVLERTEAAPERTRSVQESDAMKAVS